MTINFYKFHGTGNDFIMVDNRDNAFSKNDTILINRLCHRRFGIGADGLILLENPENEKEDFRMVYFNADGNQSSMCGNGGRCLVAFAKYLGIIEDKAGFTAIDGFHLATVENDIVSLKMQDVEVKGLNEDALFLDTGSPHHIIFTEEVGDMKVRELGAKIRYSAVYEKQGGTNVNFVQQEENNTFLVRTYERGVEDETYSCGTGVTAVALAAHATGKSSNNEIDLKTPGGLLKVSFEKQGDHYRNIWLRGPAQFVFKGEIDANTKG
ncbi:diaminopimelate epimerase [Antarcticibacterium flavum]|uniref:Diaminopimelate epimerase n=1 Tax=Antarcticibacterium flavum TaxID=2058175 RepID=A0A5B7X521_9FLAO|nr:MULTISPECIES: diaminopimelate epimerase [Antarcticibacterium]MCM4161086.1 diaminopimelate epimerase [Antarcticibacterium sp. W02-3]QCY70487.1 diaminopimelate epimerase [Antarcticibacterium flavum]